MVFNEKDTSSSYMVCSLLDGRARAKMKEVGLPYPSLPPAMLDEGTISFLPSQQELINAHISWWSGLSHLVNLLISISDEEITVSRSEVGGTRENTEKEQKVG